MFLVKLDLFRKNCQTNGICAHERKQGLQIAMGSDSLSLMVSSIESCVALSEHCSLKTGDTHSSSRLSHCSDEFMTSLG